MRTSTGTGFDNGAEIPKVDALGRRRWSIEQRERIVAEALAPDTSVAEVARRHGLNANLIFKWLKCAKDGGPDRRRRPAARGEPITFVPIQVVAKTGCDAVAAPVRALTIDHAAPPRTQGAGEKPPGKPRREVNGSARRGAIEISLPSGARVSVGAEADEAVLRLVLSAMKEL
jgi:transposase